MKAIAALFILFSLTARAQDPGLVRFVETDGQRVLLQMSEGGRISLDPALHFEAAVDEIAALLGASASSSQVVENLDVTMSKSDFQKLAHLWPEMPLKAPWSARLSITRADTETVRLKILKGLWRRSETPALSAAEKIWLGCDEAQVRCLGMTETVSNPNLLGPMPTSEESRLMKAQPAGALAVRAAALTPEDLAAAFTRARFPPALAGWMAAKLLSRRHAVLEPSAPNPYLRATLSRNDGALFRRGQLISAPEGFEADLTLQHLEARLQGFLASRLGEVQKLAEFVLSHFPYMTIETDKSIGGWSVSPGFMIRVKRRVEKNVHAKNADEQYRVEDTLEVFASITFGPHFERGIFNVGAGVGPAYVRRYTRMHLAATEEQARQGYWRIPKELILRKTYGDLAPRERLTIQSGWLANASLNGNVRVLGQSKIRPQAWLMGNHQWLSLSHVYRAQDGDIYLGRGSSRGFELSSQAFWRVVSKIARIPVLNFRRSWMSAKNDVYKIRAEELNAATETAARVREALDGGDTAVLPATLPRVTAEASYRTGDLWLDWGFGNRDERRWSGTLSATPPREGPSWLEAGQNFLLFEKTETATSRWSLSPAPKFERCAYWAALATKTPLPAARITAADLLESTLKISCSLRFEGRDLFDETQARRLARKLQLDDGVFARMWDEPSSRLNTDLQWSLVIAKEDLEPLFAEKPTGWIKDFADEIEAARRSRPQESFEAAQERLLLRTALMGLFAIREPAKRLEKFFEWLSDSGARDLFTQGFLKRGHHHQIEIKRWTAAHADRRLVFQEFKIGEVPASPTFELLEERDKWFGH